MSDDRTIVDPEVAYELQKYGMRFEGLRVPPLDVQKPQKTRDKNGGRGISDSGPSPKQPEVTNMEQQAHVNGPQVSNVNSVSRTPEEAIRQGAADLEEMRNLLKQEASLPRQALKVAITGAVCATMTVGAIAVYNWATAPAAPAKAPGK